MGRALAIFQKDGFEGKSTGSPVTRLKTQNLDMQWLESYKGRKHKM